MPHSWCIPILAIADPPRRISLWPVYDASLTSGKMPMPHVSTRRESLFTATPTNRKKLSTSWPTFGNDYALVRKLLAYGEKHARTIHKISLNYSAGYWTPPLTPRLAFDLESGQIAQNSSTSCRWFRSPITTTSRRPCSCEPSPPPATFRSPSSGASPSGPTRPFTSASTTCPASRAPSGCAPSRNSLPIPPSPVSPKSSPRSTPCPTSSSSSTTPCGTSTSSARKNITGAFTTSWPSTASSCTPSN